MCSSCLRTNSRRLRVKMAHGLRINAKGNGTTLCRPKPANSRSCLPGILLGSSSWRRLHNNNRHCRSTHARVDPERRRPDDTLGEVAIVCNDREAELSTTGIACISGSSFFLLCLMGFHTWDARPSCGFTTSVPVRAVANKPTGLRCETLS